MKTCSVLAQIKSITTCSIYYFCCKICFSKVIGLQDEYICYKCNLQIKNPLPRFKFSFEIFDGSALTRVVAFGNVVNKFIGTNAIQFLKWKKRSLHEYNISKEMLNSIIAQNLREYFIDEWFYFKFNLKNVCYLNEGRINTPFLNFSIPIINLKWISMLYDDIETLVLINFFKAAKLGSFSTIIHKTNLLLKKQKLIKFHISRIESPNQNKFNKINLVNNRTIEIDLSFKCLNKVSDEANKQSSSFLRSTKNIKLDTLNSLSEMVLSKHYALMDTEMNTRCEYINLRKLKHDGSVVKSPLVSYNSPDKSKKKDEDVINNCIKDVNQPKTLDSILKSNMNEDYLAIDGSQKQWTTIIDNVNLNESGDLFSPCLNSPKTSCLTTSTPLLTNNKPPKYFNDIYRKQSPMLFNNSTRTTNLCLNNLNNLADVLSDKNQHKLEYIKCSVVFMNNEVKNILADDYFRNHSPMISSNNKFKNILDDQSGTTNEAHLGFNFSSLYTNESNKICDNNQSNDLFE